MEARRLSDSLRWTACMRFQSEVVRGRSICGILWHTVAYCGHNKRAPGVGGERPLWRQNRSWCVSLGDQMVGLSWRAGAVATEE
jgi:hypothetical protein